MDCGNTGDFEQECPECGGVMLMPEEAKPAKKAEPAKKAKPVDLEEKTTPEKGK